MKYLIEPRHWMSKAMNFYFCKKIWAKLSAVSMDKSFMTPQKIKQPVLVRLLQRRPSKKQQKQQVIWLEIRLQEKLQKPLQKVLERIHKNGCATNRDG